MTSLNRIVRDRSRNDGFSLVELLVVVAILAILAAISIPLFLNQKNKAYQSTAQSDARNLATDLTAFFSKCTTYGPATPAAFHSGTTFSAPAGTASCVEPSSFTATLSDSSTIGASLAGTAGWCVVIDNNTQDAKITKRGLIASGTGLTCVAGDLA